MSTSESTIPKKAYHHGDLRAALIEAGLQLLAERQADDLSLREVARAVGVSATAVYRHFPDKTALTVALGREGLARLGKAQRRAYAEAGGGAPGFGATGAAYVRFALANPALYRMIFSSPPVPGDVGQEGVGKEEDAMAFLQENAAALAPPGVNPRVFALQAWSVAHGLAMLLLDGQVTADDALIDAVIDTHLDTGKC